MMGTVRARVRGIVREGGRTVVQAIDDAGREYAVEVPGDIAAAAPACSSCGPSCGCGPCRLRHAGDHDHDHDHDRELVLVVAWSLHELPPVTTTTGAAAEHAASQPEPASAASVDAAFMALLNFKPPAPAAVNTFDDLLALLLGPPG